MKKYFFVVAAVFPSSQLLAQDSTFNLLDEVIVTANKFDQKQSQTGKVVTVITKEQLEKSSGKTVGQVLNEQAGIIVNGAFNVTGTVQTVFMRGASSGRTLVLIDGIPVNDPSAINNEFDLNLFSINDVERIEICKGAQSTLYGSDAIAGAINIITVKKDISKPFTIKMTTVAGNKNTTRNNIQVYGKTGHLTYISRFATLSTNGFSAANDSSNNNNFDNDGHTGNTLNTSVQYQVSPSFSASSSIQHSQYKAAIDAGIFSDEKDYNINNNNLMTGAGIHFKKEMMAITANYRYGEFNRTYKNDSFFVLPFGTKFENNKYEARTQYAELFGNIIVAPWMTLLAGVDYRWGTMNQQFFSLSSFGPYSSRFNDSSLHQTSFYSSAILHLLKTKLTIELGGRINIHSKYGSNTTYSFNPSFTITKNWRVFGSIASGYKAPTIFQVYDIYSGNPSLKAETSTNYEMGIQQNHNQLYSRVVFFHRTITNGIDYDYVNFQYFNFVKQKVNGLEAEITARLLKHFSFSLNYTFISGEEETQSRKSTIDTAYHYLLRRPKHTANINIGYQLSEAISFSISSKLVSKRYDIGGFQKDDQLLNSYLLFNAYAEYKWKAHVRFFADGQNLTNKKFFDLRGYNAIPLLISGGISIQL